ncbi:MAG: hypothetical protein ABTQ31_08890 [Rhizobiaceae bacterium]
MTLRVAIGIAAALLCPAGVAIATESTQELLKPAVRMNADPEPPFTYWAPEGSSVVNHPRVKGVWIAEIEGKASVYYFGDLCKASEFQMLVGSGRDHLPAKPQNANWRFICSGCAALSDLHYDRLNILFDEKTDLIESVSCG